MSDLSFLNEIRQTKLDEIEKLEGHVEYWEDIMKKTTKQISEIQTKIISHKHDVWHIDSDIEEEQAEQLREEML